MERSFLPVSVNWAHRSWSDGSVDFAIRPPTDLMEGQIKHRHHVLFATTAGGTRQTLVETESGHRYEGVERAGDISYVPAGMARRSMARDAAYEWISLSISDSLFRSVRSESGGGLGDRDAFTNQNDPLLYHLMLGLRDRIRKDGALDPCYAETVATLAAHHILADGHNWHDPTTDRHHLPPRSLRKVREYIAAHLGQPIKLRDLADVACLSPGHFHRAFKRQTGQTPHRFVEQVRMDSARRMLLESAQCIGEIAFTHGYESQSHFAARFRRAFGVTPSQFRNIGRS